MIIDPDGLVWYMELYAGKKPRLDRIHYNEGIGSGATVALTALDFGANVIEAVNYAMHRDCLSGGDIRLIDLAKPLPKRAEDIPIVRPNPSSPFASFNF